MADTVSETTIVPGMPALRAWTKEDARDVAPTIPTLVIANGRDRPFPLNQSRELVARLPDARFVAVEGKGHSFPGNTIADHIAPFLGASGDPSG